ncbi:hypothetical protein [Aminipila terrae]|uniref:Uncharacterized protein n=1 Tax=Aminipila terrae TaxID=2697030 RepID=A0A6P1MK92_9FIRM|nr:hypothetical protein [Aminipila terrae]QHI73563.1 hypothetical protein Ami3637_15330 [Aminipila terrae]
MMKKIAIFMMVIVMAGVLISGCGKDKAVSQRAPEKHDYYKISNDSEGNLAALFFLGSDKEEIEKKAKELMDQYDVSEEEAKKTGYEMVNVDNGSEWYLVVPKYEGSTIQIDSVKLTEQGNLETDKELLTTDKPVVLQCNISDIAPSSQVTVTLKDKKVVFNPAISLKDGKIVKFKGVYTE